MGNLFYYLGRKTGKALRKPKWYYKSFFGDELQALQAENAFGRELTEELKKEFQLVQDKDITEYLKPLINTLISKVKKAGRRFTFIPVHSSDLNAFALPGGYVFITDTLIRYFEQNPDALAFILAHEMVHVVSRHPLKRILTGKTLTVLSNILKTGTIAGQLARHTITSLIESKYSQENEFFADQYALQLIIACGFRGSAAEEALYQLSRRYSSGYFNYFSTHPSLSERIERLQNELKNLPI